MTTLLLVTAASFIGSLHCVGMCGPFVGFYSVQGDEPICIRHLAYHLGRLLAYVTLGSIVGALGRGVLFLGGTLQAQRTLAVVMGVAMIGAGLFGVARRGVRFEFPGLHNRFNRWLTRLHVVPGRVQTAAIIGLFSTLLPCGYLYSFAFAAGSTAGVFNGMLVMFSFWLGTVPSLLGVGWLAGSAPRPFLRRIALLTPLFMIVFGSLAISGKWVAIPNLGSEGLCHEFPAWTGSD